MILDSKVLMLDREALPPGGAKANLVVTYDGLGTISLLGPDLHKYLITNDFDFIKRQSGSGGLPYLRSGSIQKA